MAKVIPFERPQGQPAKLSAHDALKIIRAMAQDSKAVFICNHARQRQLKHGITRRQVMTCLKKGSVTEGPFVNMHGHWQVNVSRFAAGEEITCVVAIEWDQQLVVVTVYPG